MKAKINGINNNVCAIDQTSHLLSFPLHIDVNLVV